MSTLPKALGRKRLSKEFGKKHSHNPDRFLYLEEKLDSHKRVVKIGEDSTGLLLKDKDVLIEGEATVGGDLTVGGNTLTFGNS